ncbi:hypothetical protein ACVS2C_003551 [Vibrio parahaemolyticus]|nr:hypothetical protein [Vibrio parahaemolyticus]EGR1382680.1 hypothetical protein [Vibrio parahaemolyticus]EJS4021045.1 hypothetical protein [Vibrio parahaemolyticus]ELA7500305.1 hypothetical protein [Vibrio parahaemolyticus]ELA7675170.1 hypothetical protein [Vibrio parahaemolyticus]
MSNVNDELKKVDLSDVSIDKLGRVVVKDTRVSKAIQDKMKKIPVIDAEELMLNNCNCKATEEH